MQSLLDLGGLMVLKEFLEALVAERTDHNSVS
jgi:hypothetical protein